VSDHTPRLEGALPPATLDDPHLLPSTRNPKRMEALAALAMVVGIVGFCAFIVAYWVDANNKWEAATLGVGMLGLGVGVIAWGKYLMPQGPFVEERHDFHSTDEEREAMTAAITQRGGMVVGRRRLLGGLFALGSTVMGVVLLFPLLRSLGPKPAKSEGTTGPTAQSLFTTNWRQGSQLITVDGRAVTVNDLDVGGVLTVFPRGFAGSSPDQVILIRLAELGPEDPPYPIAPPGHTSWGVQGYVAYSKLCTHLGCPVGLYQEQTQQLVCPCHQSIFNVNAGAVPEFGPAPRPLPQLPITVDTSGYLVANGGLNQAPGPGFWERPAS
jgi:ubiquinol-cytochrome c reductase iron-sulfur subunit